jgi:hypothetical protein
MAAIAGWTGMVLFLLREIPSLSLHQQHALPDNGAAIGALPRDNGQIPDRGRPEGYTAHEGAAVAFLIYAPFAFIPALGDWLISVVVGQVMWVLER